MKKARLDLLEEMPDVEPAKSEVQPAEEEAPPEPVPSDQKVWAFNKLLILAIPVVAVVVILCLVVVYVFFYSKPSKPSQTEVARKAAPVKEVPKQPQMQPEPERTPEKPVLPEKGEKMDIAPPGRLVYIKDFMIDLKDARGNVRVLICDFAFDVAGSGHEKMENNIDVRNIIYKTVQSRSAGALKSPEERKKLKKDLADQLDHMMGKGFVKNVYFTNYFIM